jgi:glycosyltransferase involved in cell wall biosynthesis
VVTLPSGKEIRLLFVGTLNYAPNEEAVRDILRDLLPELGKSEPGWHLSIVGRHASPELESMLKATAQVELLVDVVDIAACYAAAQIVLVPLRAGGGTKLKTLEAFAHRRPLVSTQQGVRGLDAVAGQHYLPANDAKQFAAAILQLAGDPALARRIAEAGWNLWQMRYRQP